PPSASTIQRLVIQRGLRRVTILGIVVLVLLILVIGGLVTGVFTGDDGDGQLSPAEVVEEARPRTVLVVTNKGFGAGGRGSGWVWDASEGLIVTNAHVVGGGESYSVSTGDKLTIAVGEEVEIEGEDARDAELKGAAFCEDIAVLEVRDKTGLETMPRVPKQEELKKGQDVVAVGYPSTLNLTQGQQQQDADLTANTGVISTVQTTFQAIPGEGPDDPTVGPYRNVILTDTVINQGNSGGPLVDREARLVGMNSAVRTDVQGQNYAVGVDRINEIVPKLIEGDDPC
ncbi:MAG: S1C family serine protease, partial [Actinomycetota bacterium]|nr:S1C family serine protease [Actinomycetota bacterium]